MYLVTADEMREMDRRTITEFGLPGRILMENAGRGAADILLDRFSSLDRLNVGIVAGRGNNGGDGYVIARYLAHKGIPVTVYVLAAEDQIHGDAADNLRLLRPLGIPVHEVTSESAFSQHRTPMGQHTVWVDAMLGTGLSAPVRGRFRTAIEFLNRSESPILAVDIPSGLNTDTGQPWGSCICADTTVTFAFPKSGHLLYPGADFTGRLEIIDIGIPPHIVESVAPRQYRISSETIRNCWEPRPSDAHKGTTGHVLILAGSPGKTGAAAMTAMSAMRSGAGLVTLGIPRSLNPVLETQVLEAMTYPLPESPEALLDETAFDAVIALLADKKCIVMGPGLGTHPGTKALLHRLLIECRCPAVIDADGLNGLSGHTDILKQVETPVILTPHPGEMARLTGLDMKQIQSDRIGSARAFAETHHVHVVLKGAGTVVAHPDGRVSVNTTGNPGMASGGMGDVLTGLIAGLLTQGLTPEAATHGGVYLHGMAADALAATRGPVGFLAGEVMNAIPGEIRRLLGLPA